MQMETDLFELTAPRDTVSERVVVNSPYFPDFSFVYILFIVPVYDLSLALMSALES
jgi:hypothetical protein